MTFIQALEMMGKLWEINGIVRLLIDKFLGIRAELIYSNDNQQEWNFRRFVENPRKKTERNPVESREKQISFQPRKERILKTSQKWWMKNHCIFCKEASHNLIDCKKVTNISQRKKNSSVNETELKGKGTCCNCNDKHHTSICYTSVKQKPSVVESHQKLLVMTTRNQNVICPIEVILE